MKRESKVSPKIEEDKPEGDLPLPTLVTLKEFVSSISKQHTNYYESLGGFAYWIKKEGCPKKWPYDFWLQKFNEFLERKTK